MAKQQETIDPEIKLDPRMRDPVIFNRIREMVQKEALHQAWGCKLWSLERFNKITREQRMAGDSYIRLTDNYRNVLYGDEEPETDADKQAVKRLKKRYGEVQELLTKGDIHIRRAVDELCFEELHPGCETDLRRIRDGLTRLEIFFSVGRTNSERSTKPNR